MILDDSEIRRSLARVEAAFPCLQNWEYHNEVNASYSGFSIWGEFVRAQDDPTSPVFFITFATHEATWTGHLTIGKHCYYWSSADCGDSHLLETTSSATLDEVITTLKRQMAELFAALSGRGADPHV